MKKLAYKARVLVIAPIVVLLMSFGFANTDFERARQTAIQKHELILLNFSGSDWCIPCIRMRKDIFENEAFIKMADTSIILFNADFPRNKKNLPDAKTQKQNDELAEKYNTQGMFPYTLLIDGNGNVLKTWSGLPKENAQQFTQEIKDISNEYGH